MAMRHRPSIGRNAAVEVSDRTVSIVIVVFFAPDLPLATAIWLAMSHDCTSGCTPRSIFRQVKHVPLHGSPGPAPDVQSSAFAIARASVDLPTPVGPEKM